MAISTGPAYPQRNDPDFADKADAWNAYLANNFTPEANALTAEANGYATTATTQAGIATTQAGLATNQVALATTQVSLATIQANAAAASASSALLAPGTSATSSTSNAVGTGSKTFTIQIGKFFVAGMTLKADSSGNWMIGNVVSYNSGTGELILNVTNIFGSGTLSSWTISISAPMPDVPGGYSVFSFNNFI